MVRPMVHSTKHYVQTSVSSITGGLSANVTIVDSVAVGSKNTPSEVEEGSSVKAIYFEHWLKAGEASNLGSFIAIIYKVPGTGAAMSFAQMAALSSSENKKNVFYTTQGLMNNNSGSATNFVRGWIKIPKSKQRMGLGDRVLLSISAAASIDLDHCGFATYKEYS